MDESELKVLGACLVCAVLLVTMRARAADAPVTNGPSRQPAIHSRVTNQVSAAMTIAPTMSRTFDALTTGASGCA